MHGDLAYAVKKKAFRSKELRSIGNVSKFKHFDVAYQRIDAPGLPFTLYLNTTRAHKFAFFFTWIWHLFPRQTLPQRKGKR